MFWFIFAIAITLIVTIVVLWQEDGKDWFGFAFLTTAVFTGVIALFLGFIPIGQHYYQKTVVNQQLQSLKDGSSIHGSGSFFLGIGSFSVNSSPSYTYYSTDPDGSYSLHTTDAKHVEVFQDNTTPRLVCTEKARTVNRFYQPLGGDYYSPVKTCQFHVPPDSIIHSYKLGQ